MLKRFDLCSEAFQLLGSFQVACILWEFFGLAPPPFSGALHIIAIDQNRSGSLTSFAFVLLIIISGATTTAPFDLARASDCLAVPNSPAPKGSHWHYQLVALAPEGSVANGRVGMWRGCCRLSISVAASFVWRCLSGSTLAPFPHSAHRTWTCRFPASGSRTRLHAFAHGTSRPSAVRRTSPKCP